MLKATSKFAMPEPSPDEINGKSLLLSLQDKTKKIANISKFDKIIIFSDFSSSYQTQYLENI